METYSWNSPELAIIINQRYLKGNWWGRLQYWYGSHFKLLLSNWIFGYKKQDFWLSYEISNRNDLALRSIWKSLEFTVFWWRYWSCIEQSPAGRVVCTLQLHVKESLEIIQFCIDIIECEKNRISINFWPKSNCLLMQ